MAHVFEAGVALVICQGPVLPSLVPYATTSPARKVSFAHMVVKTFGKRELLSLQLAIDNEEAQSLKVYRDL